MLEHLRQVWNWRDAGPSTEEYRHNLPKFPPETLVEHLNSHRRGGNLGVAVAGAGLLLILTGGFPETSNAWTVAVIKAGVLSYGIILKLGFNRNLNLVTREIESRFNRQNIITSEDTYTTPS